MTFGAEPKLRSPWSALPLSRTLLAALAGLASLALAACSHDGLSQVPGPVITACTPTSGSVGDTVVCTGFYFNNANTVTFNGAPSAFTVSGSATQFTTTVPDGATSGDISILTAAGQGSWSTFTVLGPPAQLAFVQQPSDTASGSPIAPPVSVAVEDAAGHVILSATNAIALTASGGTLTQPAPTMAAGVATFTGLSLNALVGSYTLTATSGQLAPATSKPFAISAGPGVKLAFTQQPSDAQSGAAIAPPVTVSVEDSGGNLVTVSTLSAVQLTASGGTLAGALASANNGAASFPELALAARAGSYTLTATDPSGTYQPATSAPFQISAGQAAQLAFTQVPPDAQSGIAMSPVLVAVEDSAGNVVASSSAPIALGASAGLFAGGAAQAAAAGIATFAPTLTGTSGSYTLTATSNGLTPASAQLQLLAGNPAQLAFTQLPSAPQSGAPMTPALQVSVEDSAGNIVLSSSGAVSIAASAGTLSGGGPVSASSGVATFAATLTGSTSHNPYTLTATSSGLSSATAQLQLSAGAASALVFTQQPPAAAQSGIAFTSAVEVSIEDSAGNLLTGSTDQIGLVVNGSGATLAGGAAVQVAGGIATFLPTLTGVAGSYTLTASTHDSISGALTSSPSSAIQLGAGSAAQLAFTALPANPQSGLAMSPVKVSVEDSAGNVLASVSPALSIALSSSGGALTGTVTASTVGAVASFSPVLTAAVGPYTLTATPASPSTLTPANATIELAAGAAQKLAFTVEPPASAQSGIAMPAVQVSVEDSFGNLVSSSTESIKLTSTAGTLSGGAPVAAVAGVATFTPTLAGSIAGNPYKLTAADNGSGGLASALSSPIALSAGLASQLAFAQAPPADAGCANAITPAVTVHVEDSAGNLVTTSASASDVIALQPSASLAVTSGTQTATAGVATFTGLSLHGSCAHASDGCTLTATTTDNVSNAALQSPPAGPITLTSGIPSAMVFSTEPPANIQSRTFTAAVTIQDACGNATASTAPVSMAIGNNPSGGTLAGTTPVNAAAGVATFSDLAIAAPGIGYTLVASSSGLANATSTPFTVPWVTVGTTGVLAAGESHSCALVRDGVACWGDNENGALGYDAGSLLNNAANGSGNAEPAFVSGLASGVQALAAGEYSTCAAQDKRIFCWGENTSGQLGNNSTVNSQYPSAVAGIDGGVQGLAAGGQHACAIVNGRIDCWGANSGGQLGNGSGTNSLVPVQVTGLDGGAQAIAAGEFHTCAIINGGVQCWGNNGNGYGALGNNKVGVNSSVPVQVSGITGGATAIAANGYHSCAVVNGLVQCWGDNTYGELGNGSTTASPVPVPVSGIAGGATAVAVGNDHSCAIVNGGALCWGRNNNGQLGNNSTVDSPIPVQVDGLTSGVQALAAGGGGNTGVLGHTCALVNGAVQCWGANGRGELGINSTVNQLIPAQTLGMTAGEEQLTQDCALINGGAQCWGPTAGANLPTSGVQAIASDSGYACVLINGGVKCWSGNGAPAAVSGLTSGVQSISVNATGYACAVVNGSAKCWGSNSYGALGNGSTAASATPTQVTGLTSGVQSISTGDRSACALVNGGLQCWGDDQYGEMGNNTSSATLVLTPQPVPSLTGGVQSISVGGECFVCALVNGGLDCWGCDGNGNGQLGSNNPNSNELVPTPVYGLSLGVQAISSGYDSACANMSGDIQCWGDNSSLTNQVDYGLGNNSAAASSPVPVQVSGITTSAQTVIAGRNQFGCALVNGAISCWGDGAQGDLNNGSTANASTPTAVTGLTGLPP